MSEKKLFGTDGVRGKSNEYPITPDTVLKIGQAIGLLLRRQGDGEKKVLIGKDTRLSGYMIEQALACGLNSMGVHVQLVGPLPTPGIGFLARNMRVDAGVVISASHNAFYDNGIKIFGSDGYKIPDKVEKEIEGLVLNENLEKYLAAPHLIGRTRRIDDSAGRYIVYAKNSFPLDHTLEGMRIILDTANGAGYKVAPMIYRELGAEVIAIGNSPNGTNINDEVGALHTGRVQAAVREYRGDVGISLDGDADRVIMVDENGEIVNGDHILGICAIHLKELNKLPYDTIVTTVMSNYGLEKTMTENGIKVVKTSVGDKHVVEEMRKYGYLLGGEQSGHIIFHDHSTTGDGVVASLNVLATMIARKQKLSKLRSVIEDVPQVLVNVRVKKRTELAQLEGYNDKIQEISDSLEGRGRIFVRFSGTEPVVRVLVEGPDQREINSFAEGVAKFVESALN